MIFLLKQLEFLLAGPQPQHRLETSPQWTPPSKKLKEMNITETL